MSKVNLIIVATINQSEKEALSYYLEKIAVLYEQVSAKSVGKYKISKASIGEYNPSLVSIMEFPDIVSFDKVFESEEYKKLIPYREKAFLKVEAYLSE
jgi:uncharacterized protein (DUF1330 family)